MSCTFHVPFALKDDERVTPTPALFVPDNPYPFNRTVYFELAAKVFLGQCFVLRRK